MAKKFRQLLDTMPEERRQRIEEHTRQLLAEMPLQELRKVLQLTQQQVAATLKMNQAAVSKLESQTDMYVSTLRRFVEAMGGELRIVAHFPQGDVAISQFEKINGETEQASAG
jgi:transcriptional regulator with XRE-family HTH domain